MLRTALRRIVRDRGFTLAAVLALGLGIGGASTVFTLLNGIVLRGLPTPNPDRIAMVGIEDSARRGDGVSFDEFGEWQRSVRSFSVLTALATRNMTLNEPGHVAERFLGAFVSSSTFEMLAEDALLGRALVSADDEPGALPVLVLGYSVWTERYAGDPAVLGRSVRVNGTLAATIVGVMGPGFRYPNSADMWVALAHLPEVTIAKDARVLEVVGRLREDVTMAAAQVEVDSVLQRSVQQGQAGPGDRVQATVSAYTAGSVGRPIQLILGVLLAAVGLLVVIGCVNVANLLLARGVGRRREVAIRMAIGGSRRAVVAEMLLESLLLAVLGGALGLALSLAGTRAFDLVTRQFDDRPYWFNFAADAQVLGFLCLVSAGTVLIFGVLPAFRTTDVNASDALGVREGRDSNPRRWTDALVVIQLALTLALLSGAALMARTVIRSLDPGFNSAPLTTLIFMMPADRYVAPEVRSDFFATLEGRLMASPTIASAAVTSALPMHGASQYELSLDGRPGGDTPVLVDALRVSPAYFSTLGIPLLRGRSFVASDGGQGNRVAMVNDAFAKAHWPGIDPVGHQIRLVQRESAADSDWVTVIGVAPTLRQRSLGDPRPMAYLPYRTLPAPGAALIIRASGSPQASLIAARDTIRGLDDEVSVFAARSMDDALWGVNFVGQLFGSMFAVFACIALVLCTTGLYAVTSYSVSQRTREIGVRMALGASTQGVWWLVLRRVVGQLTVGVPLGLVGAIALSQVLRSALSSTTAGDPRVIAGTLFVLVIVMLAACFLPANRAARLNPISALRQD